MRPVKEIGDGTRDGLLEIADTRWDGNGTLFVTVREMIGQRENFPVRRGRALARSAIHHPDKTRSSRVVRQWWDGSQTRATYAVSRNEER